MQLAYFVSHPIQYQAPLLRRLASHPQIDLKVFFLSDFSARPYDDPGFGRSIQWDVPLLGGYEHEFLGTSGVGQTTTFFHPFVSGVYRALRSRSWTAVAFHGYAHYALIEALALCVGLRIPLLFRSESNLICTSRRPLKDAGMRWLIKRACGLLWIGSANRDYYRAYGATDGQLFFAPYAVDNDYFRARAADAAGTVEKLRDELGLERHRPVVLYAGKMIRRKNPLLLLEAFAGIRTGVSPKPYLVFVGDGELMQDVVAAARNGGLEADVRCVGFKNQSELPRYFALCDLFVIPSSKEPFGLVVNEVMNCGKPIISTDEVGATADLVKDGNNGFVVKAGDVEQLAAAMRQALADPGRLRAMGRASQELIAGWNYDRCVAGFLASLDRAAAAGARMN
jgi:glycosyltransferase involved in cell wall biosynthesis